MGQLICLVLVDVKPWKSEIDIKKYQLRGPTYYPQKNRQLFPPKDPGVHYSKMISKFPSIHSSIMIIFHNILHPPMTLFTMKKAIYVYYRV